MAFGIDLRVRSRIPADATWIGLAVDESMFARATVLAPCSDLAGDGMSEPTGVGRRMPSAVASLFDVLSKARPGVHE